MTAQVTIRHLGLTNYATVFADMQRYTVARDANSADELWVTQHHPVFTQGQAGRAEHVLAPAEIPIVQTDRGGQVTYHGPGQIVVYLLLDLKRLGLGVKALVRGIEQSMIDTLASNQIAARRRDDAPGVYVAGDKIGALGLRVKRGCSYHGLSLNVAMDLGPFARINPCGLTDIGVTQMQDCLLEHGAEPSRLTPDLLLQETTERLLRALGEVFSFDLSEGALARS
ncbi:MAG: lipoyl(octanoyl) transferase LipB [Pseudomonadales bacterium]